MNQLEAQNLTLTYEKTIIVRDLNLSIPTGKISILVGANGCGKSTLLRGLGNLLKPHSGTVYLDGKAITKLPNKWVAQKLGILPQNPLAPEGLTVRELIAQGRYPYQNWWQQWSVEDEKFVQKALATVNLIEFADRPLDTLSGGQRQRAWIGMVLAQNTDILLLDEPTTFLDLAHQIEVLDLLYELHHQKTLTIVMVLHDLNLACRYADHLIAIRNQQIYSQGHPQQIMTQTMVKDVFGLDCQIMIDPIALTPMCIPLTRKYSSS
ncbi:ABC transporter related (plasmid) [Gloeothece citriformis PCC 7424]|uniref:ABC transporter related n=1 Tax=Gloeothece citriformis (strain PCC 7424) TaxID=65393 RepID=B7KLY9_GLOC7|nr:ABC transporter ATP-binding protein [Gloeothece citriformis]ACK73811.1 ABC transporter related [Gloeothece citriformis PCC 7424]